MKTYIMIILVLTLGVGVPLYKLAKSVTEDVGTVLASHKKALRGVSRDPQ